MKKVIVLPKLTPTVKKTHLDYKYFRDNAEIVRKNIELRKMRGVDIDKVVQLYDRQCSLVSELGVILSYILKIQGNLSQA